MSTSPTVDLSKIEKHCEKVFYGLSGEVQNIQGHKKKNFKVEKLNTESEIEGKTEFQEIKSMLTGIQIQLNRMDAEISTKVYHMADLKKLFNVKRHETVLKRIMELSIIPLPTRHLQVTEISLRKAGLL